MPAALFSSLAAEKAFSYPLLPSGRIFTLSFSAGVSKNRLGTGYYRIKSSVHEKQNHFFFLEEKMKQNRPVEEKIGDLTERSLPGNSLHGSPIESEVFLQASANFDIDFFFEEDIKGLNEPRRRTGKATNHSRTVRIRIHFIRLFFKTY
ncbi:hypothetical protein C6Y45_11595 [Alkalicoccus saliphilus]|uniref:Uncharacterized protein n=1 Tax=Alkalicoccus saliphilus TaxID=200989 RepID=A0A2T4U4W5_9BACI|nr:hypothetical protein C6Y45_11595 [Alkalicoccus saliphilus]